MHDGCQLRGFRERDLPTYRQIPSAFSHCGRAALSWCSPASARLIPSFSANPRHGSCLTHDHPPTLLPEFTHARRPCGLGRAGDHRPARHAISTEVFGKPDVVHAGSSSGDVRRLDHRASAWAQDHRCGNPFPHPPGRTGDVRTLCHAALVCTLAHSSQQSVCCIWLAPDPVPHSRRRIKREAGARFVRADGRGGLSREGSVRHETW